jgi:hypothetical protein
MDYRDWLKRTALVVGAMAVMGAVPGPLLAQDDPQAGTLTASPRFQGEYSQRPQHWLWGGSYRCAGGNRHHFGLPVGHRQHLAPGTLRGFGGSGLGAG